ncbi:MAG: hypothetical protein A3K45_08350 [Chloroflexi bacterium RIFOXYC12_FULL_59_14]|nr:MAG: hypothetical protein A3K45_08350 [Chloroflexi bacterium RIFOXYC12_FULL_59_14]
MASLGEIWQKRQNIAFYTSKKCKFPGLEKAMKHKRQLIDFFRNNAILVLPPKIIALSLWIIEQKCGIARRNKTMKSGNKSIIKFNPQLKNVGWRINNEMILLMEEIKLLDDTEKKLTEIITATSAREEGLHEIRDYITNNFSPTKSHQ